MKGNEIEVADKKVIEDFFALHLPLNSTRSSHSSIEYADQGAGKEMPI